MEGLKVALGRCDASRFRVVAALLRGGWATVPAMEWREREEGRERRRRRSRKACKAMPLYGPSSNWRLPARVSWARRAAAEAI